jgi:hypothetical protein
MVLYHTHLADRLANLNSISTFSPQLKENVTFHHYKYHMINPQKPNGIYTYQPLNYQWLCILYLKVLYDSQVADYKHRGPGFDSRALLRIFLRELGLERGPLSRVIG